jgi:hypothetical protein
MSNIVATHARFGTNVQHLRDLGVEISVHHDDADLSDIQLEEPKYGEMLLGTVTDDERQMFIDLYRANVEMEGLTREYMGAAITRLGDAIRTSDRHKPFHEAVREDAASLDFGGPDNQLAFFRLQQKINVLKSMLYWSLGERFDAHDWSIGIRSKWRAVKVACRIPPQ